MRELLLLNLEGLHYAVWKDEIVSQDVQAIHWLTNTAKVNYAISIINKHTITLVDLSTCIGLAPMSRERKSSVLLMSDQDKVAGFLVEGEIEQLQISSDAVYSMPEYLQTAIIDTCVLFGSSLIPVINISELQNRVRGVDFAPVVPNFQLPPGSKEKETDSSLKRLRVFVSSGKTFAASASNIKTEMVKVGSISGLALTPKHIRGITFHNGTVLTVIDLASLMEQPTEVQPDQMLIVAMVDQHFGCLVDEDVSELSSNDFSVKSLPRLVRSDWLQIAAIRNKRIIPIIDLWKLLAARTDAVEQESRTRKFTFTSQFKSRFGKKEVEVVEFDLLGALHALPKLEAEVSFPFKAYRPIPNTDLIVAGIVVHEGELLPVLDLARCFGRRALPTSKWHLILVKNGDFRFFVMTEFLVGERKLSVDMQRELPFELPDSVVYGCYPIENSVRLILNIQALAVHFNDEQAQEFINVFSGDLQQPSKEINTFVQESLDQKFDPQKEKVISEPPEYIEEEEGEKGEDEYAVTEKPELLSAISESTGMFLRDSGVQTKSEKGKEVEEREEIDTEEVSEVQAAEAMAGCEAEAVEAETLRGDEPEAELETIELVEEWEDETGIRKDKELTRATEIAEFSELGEYAQVKTEARINAKYIEDREDTEYTEIEIDTENIVEEEVVTENHELLSAVTEFADLCSRDIGLQAKSEQGKEVEDRTDLEPEKDEEEQNIEAMFDAEVEAVVAEMYQVDELEAEPEAKEPAEKGEERSQIAEDEESKETLNGVEHIEIEESVPIEADASENVISLKDSENRDETVEAEDTGNIKEEEKPTLINAEAQQIEARIDQVIKQMSELGEEPEAEEAAGKDDALKEFSELLMSDLIKEKKTLLPRDKLDAVPLEEVALEHKRQQRLRYASLVFLLLVVAFFSMSGIFEKWFSNVIEQEKAEETVPAKKTMYMPPQLPEPHMVKAPIVKSQDSPGSKIVATKKEVPVAKEKSASMAVVTAASSEPFTTGNPVSLVPVSDTVEPGKEGGAGEPVVAKKQTSIPVQLPKVSVPEVAPIVPSGYFTYTVQKADTLWMISEHYTGSGFNYHKLTEENKIQNPDLIFPDQKIMIKKIELKPMTMRPKWKEHPPSGF